MVMCKVTTAYKNYMMENKTPNFGVIVSRLKIAIMKKKIITYNWSLSLPFRYILLSSIACFSSYIYPLSIKKNLEKVISSLSKSQFLSLFFFLILFMQWNDSMAPDNLGSKAALSLSLHMD